MADWEVVTVFVAGHCGVAVVESALAARAVALRIAQSGMMDEERQEIIPASQISRIFWQEKRADGQATPRD